MKLWKEANTWQSKKAVDKLARIEPTDIHSIVVIKHAAFGDMLLLRPFLIELRKAFPGASITLSVIRTAHTDCFRIRGDQSFLPSMGCRYTECKG